MQAFRVVMCRVQRVEMVGAQYPPTSVIGILAELDGVASGANVDKETNKDMSDAQAVQVVWSKEFAPLLMKMLGEINRWVTISAVMQVPRRATS